MEYIQQAELQILNFIYENFHTEFLDTLMPMITSLGNSGGFWVALSVVMILIPKTRKIGIAAALALLIGFLITNVTLKPLVARIRPYDLNPSVQLLVNRLSDYSFPSGHSSASFAAASAMLFFDKKIGIPAVALAALIALSRLYLYVHFPTDVLAGVGIGCLAGYTAYRIVTSRRITERLHRRIS